MLFKLVDEYGAMFFIMANYIKCFYENKSPMKSAHQKAKTVVETVQGDIYYVRNSVSEIYTLFSGGRNDEEQETEIVSL